MQNEKADHLQFDRSVFVLFCAIVFSKVVWYDLRVYFETPDRRDVLTMMYLAWVLAQFFCCLTLTRKLLKHISAPFLIWASIVLIYFMVGLAHNGFTSYLANDIARYGLPLGWLLVFSWALKCLPPRLIVATILGCLIVAVFLRLGIHELVSDGRVRFGRHWEIWLIVAAVALGAISKGPWSIAALVVGISVLCMIFWIGNTRVVLVGSLLASIVCVAVIKWIWRDKGSSVRSFMVMISVVTTCAFGLSPFAPSDRLNILSAFTEDQFEELGSKPGVVLPDAEHSLLDVSRLNWISSVSRGDMSLDGRFWEAAYFFARTFESPARLVFGAGAGASEQVEINDNIRVVRGAHVTPVTLLYRHGLLFGSAIMALLVLWSVRGTYCIARYAREPEARFLGLTLLAYIISIMPLTMLHQGGFDDPLVFLAVAIFTPNAAHLVDRQKHYRAR